MNQNKYVFAQLTEFLDYDKFTYIVKKYNGDKGNRGFTCWNQMLLMIFGQLSARQSLRDLITVVEAHKSKAYHLGFGKTFSLSTLARANANRDYRIFEEFAMHVIGYAQRIRADIEFEVKTPENVYAFDSSTISLCLSVFWWAKYKRNVVVIKLHTLFDVKTQIPCFRLITPAAVNDIKAMEHIPYQRGSFYVFDRAYNSFADLHRIHRLEAYFVLRARDNLNFKRLYSLHSDHTGVKSDQIGVLTVARSAELYPDKIRMYFHFEVGVLPLRLFCICKKY